MRYITYEEFKSTDEGREFLRNNPDYGTLKIEAFTAYQSVPLENVKILITKDIEDYRIIFFQGNTNSSGMINDIELPAPPNKIASEYNDLPEYTVYNLTAVKEDFNTIKNYSIGMFGGVNVIQYIKMSVDVNLDGVINGN